ANHTEHWSEDGEPTGLIDTQFTVQKVVIETSKSLRQPDSRRIATYQPQAGEIAQHQVSVQEITAGGGSDTTRQSSTTRGIQTREPLQGVSIYIISVSGRVSDEVDRRHSEEKLEHPAVRARGEQQSHLWRQLV